MKKVTFLFLPGIAAVYSLNSCNAVSSKPLSPNASHNSISVIKRGEYLVNTIGCDDCYSPKKIRPQGPKVDPAMRFSGYPAQSPLAPVNDDDQKNGWALFRPDLTSSVGP